MDSLFHLFHGVAGLARYLKELVMIAQVDVPIDT
jgi:hypothetical protein